MKPYYQDEQVTLYCGDNLEVMSSLAKESISAIVTDPPYGLSFMGKRWDYDVPSVETWRLVFDLLKPGGHLLSFAGTRTQHRMAVNIEDAGFEIRDLIAWVYGSGFPKSLDVSKAIDKIDRVGPMEARARQFTAWMRSTGITAQQINEITGTFMGSHYTTDKSQPSVATVDLFDKLRPYLPAVPAEIEELVRSRTIESENMKRRAVVGHKSAGMGSGETFGMLQTEGRNHEAEKIIEITAPATEAARQWAGWGTALKPALEPITVARKPLIGTVAANVMEHGTGAINVDGCRVGTEAVVPLKGLGDNRNLNDDGWKGIGKRPEPTVSIGRWPANLIHDGSDEPVELLGSAARFFYCAKASKRDRDEGNNHPTVKPTDLMRYLCRLVTPPNGIILDPFMGSGSTGKAAILEGFRFIGIEQSEEYCEIALARIKHEIGKKESDKTLFD